LLVSTLSNGYPKIKTPDIEAPVRIACDLI
jgi:hypothetical protein